MAQRNIWIQVESKEEYLIQCKRVKLEGRVRKGNVDDENDAHQNQIPQFSLLQWTIPEKVGSGVLHYGGVYST